MKTRKTALALVVLLLLVFMQGQARAATIYYTGNNLVEMMREYDKGLVVDPSTRKEDVYTYVGYIVGVSDALSNLLWDAPKEVNIGQICAIVSKYLKNHPEKWNTPAVQLVVDALQEAFPLKK
jgi:hypothetical protein